MKKEVSRRLRSFVRETIPDFRLPMYVVRQLVGYYGDWRRSRDILNDIDSGRSVKDSLTLRSERQFTNTRNTYRVQ